MNFECKKCGKCCSNYLPLQEKEIKEMKKRAIKENKHLLDVNWYNICPFLNYKNECDIYDNRPLICREYSCYNYENKIYNIEAFKTIPKEDFKILDIRKEIFGGRNDN